MKGIGKTFWCHLLGVACLTALMAGLLLGQGTTGTITGEVTDPSGAVVPGASVTITNQATGVKYDLTSNAAGVYYITSVLPGTYTVQVAAGGFKNYENRDVVLSINETLRLDVKLELGPSTQTVTVEAAVPLVNTEAGRMSSLVNGSQVANMPLNGRDVYDLMQLIPGAVNSTNIDKENTAGGSQTNINGTRANFNGFLFDGMSNKGLSGGSNAEPSPDFVGEYRIETNNFDAQYSSSAGSITDVSTKSGTNQFHGDVYEFFRNDALNARNFFDGAKKSEWRQNQFGATIGGPIKKDKIFFFGGYEGERFITQVPGLYSMESQAFRDAVIAVNPNSVAALLYKSTPGPAPTSGDSVATTVTDNITNPGLDIGASLTKPYAGSAILSTNGTPDAFLGYLDPCFLSNYGVGAPAGVPSLPNLTWGNPQNVANVAAKLFGVSPAQNAQITQNIASGCPGSGLVAPGVQAGALLPGQLMNGTVNGQSVTRNTGVFYNGDQFVTRIDYQGDKNRVFGRGYFLVYKNPAAISGLLTTNALVRGYNVPVTNSYPAIALGFVHTVSPTVINEFDAGYTRNQLSDIPTPSQFGVPEVDFDTGQPSFGAYNGYPQFFNENVFNFKDMLTMSKGTHSLKVGAEFKRNYENSQFNVGRPDYAFIDPVFFAADLPYIEAAGVQPNLLTGAPSHLDTNIRAWRNYELGFFGQDDWKVTKNFTLNLGLRWDYFSPHTEKYNQATNLLIPSGGLAAINCASFIAGKGCVYPAGDTQTPNGGFHPAPSLFPGRYNDFAPRFGFAWDPFGKGKTSLRGGAAISYEGTFYNALSNSRWNFPFYSFNEACPVLCGLAGFPTYGPTDANGNLTGAAPTFSGAPSTIGNGPAGLGFAGNIMGWLPSNPNLSHLTGIPSPDYKLPYYEQFFLGVQQQISPSMVLEVNGVGTLGRHLFWAEDPNRVVGGRQASNPAINPSTTGVLNPCTGTAVFSTPFINPCFGIMRTWDTSVNSSYWGLQTSFNRKFSRGLAFTTAYTWSHSLDYRSTWHALSSGGSATDANAIGEAGYSMDPNAVYLERGNSLFDIRHRLVVSAEWDVPWMKSQQGLVGHVVGGWSVNSVVSLQSGFPFTVGASLDYNGTGIRSQRPDAPTAFSAGRSFSPCQVEANCGSNLPAGQSYLSTLAGDFPTPPAGTDGTLGRNTFTGPGFADTDFSLFKRIPLGSNEARYIQFRAEFFNLFNRTNLYPANSNLSQSTFGLAQQAFDPREIQFGLKLYF
jgi:Carboxypeptidase regulatory-like domain/TonB dependent receptor-like, beta-barrel